MNTKKEERANVLCRAFFKPMGYRGLGSGCLCTFGYALCAYIVFRVPAKLDTRPSLSVVLPHLKGSVRRLLVMVGWWWSWCGG